MAKRYAGDVSSVPAAVTVTVTVIRTGPAAARAAGAGPGVGPGFSLRLYSELEYRRALEFAAIPLSESCRHVTRRAGKLSAGLHTRSAADQDVR